MNEDLLNPLQVSKILNVSYKTVLKHIKGGKIPYIIVKNSKNLDTYMVKRTDLDVYVKIQEQTITVKRDTLKQTHTRGNKPEIDILNKRIMELELLQTHFLQQIQIKDEQIKSITGIVEKLQITNQFLLIEGNQGKTGKRPTGNPSNDETIDVEPDIEVETPKQNTPTLEPGTKKKELIDLIRGKVSKGWGDKKISQWMNKRGIETLTGKGEWFPKTIYRLRTGKG